MELSELFVQFLVILDNLVLLLLLGLRYAHRGHGYLYLRAVFARALVELCSLWCLLSLNRSDRFNRGLGRVFGRLEIHCNSAWSGSRSLCCLLLILRSGPLGSRRGSGLLACVLVLLLVR